MTEFKWILVFLHGKPARKESTVMYVCTYCHYADNICECEDQIEPNEHYFLKITTTTELVYRRLRKNERSR